MAKPRSPFSVLFVGVTLLWMFAALYMTFIYAPEEATMGPVQRIFYFHVGSAWTAFLAYLLLCVGSGWYLITRSEQADIFAHSSGEVGFVFCSLVLTTGPIWAKPVWGLWWPDGDMRLMLTLVLWLLYASYLILRLIFGESDHSATLGAVVGTVGVVVVPLDYFAIRLWRTHHPSPVIMGGEGSGLDPRMWISLMVTFGAMVALFSFLLWQRFTIRKIEKAIFAFRRRLVYSGKN